MRTHKLYSLILRPQAERARAEKSSCSLQHSPDCCAPVCVCVWKRALVLSQDLGKTRAPVGIWGAGSPWLFIFALAGSLLLHTGFF